MEVLNISSLTFSFFPNRITCSNKAVIMCLYWNHCEPFTIECIGTSVDWPGISIEYSHSVLLNNYIAGDFNLTIKEKSPNCQI